MSTKRKRGSTWHYTVRRSGVLPRPLYISFRDEAEGDEYVRRVEALLDRGIVPHEFAEVRAPSALLAPRIEDYLDTQHVAPDDAGLLTLVQRGLPQKMPLASLTYRWADQWVTSMKREQNLAPSTIRKRVGALARCLDWMTRSGDMPFNPLRSLPRGYASYTDADAEAVATIDAGAAKGDTERDRRLEDGEEPAIRRILSGAKPEGRQRPLDLREREALVALFDTALETAMRLREMYTLHVYQVDLDRRTIFLDKTKNGDKRQVPISSTLMLVLAPYLQDRGRNEQVFPWWRGTFNRQPLRQITSQLSRQWSRIFSAAKCLDLHFHDLRHEATSRIYERTTLSDVEIASITGHKDLRQLKRYANLRGSKLAERLW